MKRTAGMTNMTNITAGGVLAVGAATVATAAVAWVLFVGLPRWDAGRSRPQDRPPQAASRILTNLHADLDYEELRAKIPPHVEPAYDGNAEVKGTTKLERETVIISLTPHMHVRGKDMIYIAHYPDGKDEVLLSVPKYDFNWQITYMLAEAKTLPKGTRVEVIAHFDNSTNNKFNPDPTKDVKWGDQTWEEMMIGFFDVAIDPRLDKAAFFIRRR